jgi:hypothetical protein
MMLRKGGTDATEGSPVSGVEELTDADDGPLTEGVDDALCESASVEVAVVINVSVAVSADALLPPDGREVEAAGSTGSTRGMLWVAPPETNSFPPGLANECQSKVTSEVAGSKVWIVKPVASTSFTVNRNPSARAESPMGVAVMIGCWV